MESGKIFFRNCKPAYTSLYSFKDKKVYGDNLIALFFSWLKCMHEFHINTVLADRK